QCSLNMANFSARLTFCIAMRASLVGDSMPMARCLRQHFLQDVYIQQSAEFAADLLERADVEKAKAFVEVQTLVAPLGDARNKGVKAQRFRFVDDCLFKLPADAATALIRADVERCFRRVVVGWPV